PGPLRRSSGRGQPAGVPSGRGPRRIPIGISVAVGGLRLLLEHRRVPRLLRLPFAGGGGGVAPHLRRHHGSTVRLHVGLTPAADRITHPAYASMKHEGGASTSAGT